MEGDLLEEVLNEAKKAILTTNLAIESFKGKHVRSIDAFNFGKDVAVTSLQLIVLAIAISNPGTTLAGTAYAANGGVGIADGAIRIDQGDTFNGAMEMSLSFLEVGSGLKLVSETTSLGKYVNEFIRDNRGCVGAKKALEGGNSSGFKYKHNPSDNPKVLIDAVEDSNTVYGYRPRKDGSLSRFADGEWENPVWVEKYKQERIDYHNRNEGAAQSIVKKMTSEGASPEQIAREICNYRNQSRINSYIDKNGRITNMEGYNNALEGQKRTLMKT